jgi:hypothetical protein
LVFLIEVDKLINTLLLIVLVLILNTADISSRCCFDKYCFEPQGICQSSQGLQGSPDQDEAIHSGWKLEFSNAFINCKYFDPDRREDTKCSNSHFPYGHSTVFLGNRTARFASHTAEAIVWGRKATQARKSIGQSFLQKICYATYSVWKLLLTASVSFMLLNLQVIIPERW